MRIPGDISETDNVYTSMFAMLMAVKKHNQKKNQKKIRKVLCPGLGIRNFHRKFQHIPGTWAGKVPADSAARMMGEYIYNVVDDLGCNISSPGLQEFSSAS